MKIKNKIKENNNKYFNELDILKYIMIINL